MYMKVDILTIDAVGHATIRFDIIVEGENGPTPKTFTQDVLLPVNDDNKRRKILDQYVTDYQNSFLIQEADIAPVIEDATSRPPITDRIKEVGQAIKRIF